VPIRSIDGVFLPAYEEDLTALAPQFALANIEAMPMGGEAWFNPELLKTQKRYVNGLVFFSGKFVDETALEYIQFVNKFRSITRTSPTIFTVYGYDLMRLLIAAVEAGNISSEDIVRYLEKMKNYIGLGGSCSFSASSHVNQSVNLLQYKDGVIQKLAP
jgi:ABC-type branched-subunit amino acid transport system substrate-binding protein